MFAIRSLYYKIIKKFSSTEQYEHVTGFGLYDKEVVDLMREAEEPSPNFRNLVADYGYEIGFIEYRQPERASGKSSYTFSLYLDTAIEAFVNTSHAPMKIATFVGAFGCAMSFLVGFILLILKLIFANGLNLDCFP